jgi:hypothetical protein
MEFRAGLTITSSTVAMTRCTTEGVVAFSGPGLAGLNLTGAHVWFAEGSARGGSLISPFPIAPTPAATLNSSQLFVTGDNTTELVAGTTPATTPVPAVTSSGASNVVVAPAVRVVGHAGGGEHGGGGSYARSPLPSQVATLSSPVQLDLQLRAPGAIRGHMLLSLVPAQPVPLGPLGDWWLDWPHFVVDSGNMPTNGIRTARLVVPPMFPGQPIVVQGLVLYPSGIQLSAPAPVLVSR